MVESEEELKNKQKCAKQKSQREKNEGRLSYSPAPFGAALHPCHAHVQETPGAAGSSSPGQHLVPRRPTEQRRPPATPSPGPA